MKTSIDRLGRILVIITAVVIVACSWIPEIQRVANEQIDAGLRRALISFATARTLNAVISVAQGTDIAVQPLGIGLTLTLGQALDPINDLVEQFSSLMLIASVALGIQKVLLTIGSNPLVSTGVTAFALAWAFLYYRQQSPPWISRTLAILLMIRFALPVVSITGDVLFRQFLETEYNQSQEFVKAVSLQGEKSTSQVSANNGDTSLFERLKARTSNSVGDMKAQIDGLVQSAEQATEKIIKLMVVFLMQTIVIPLALLWALHRMLISVFLSSERANRTAPRTPSV